MWAWAYRAIHTGAPAEPKGSVHCWKSPTYMRPPAPAPPGPRLALPPAPWALPSQTERKQTTWSARPAATAMQAFITEPSWPEVSIPLSYQFTSSRMASITAVAEDPLNPLGWAMGPG